MLKALSRFLVGLSDSGKCQVETNTCRQTLRYEKLRQRYVVISWNTISTGRVFAKKLSCNFNIFQPIDVLVRHPYGQPLFLLAPDHRWCSIYSCKINQTAVSVLIFASQHQNRIIELKQRLCHMLRCAGKCEFMRLSQERTEPNPSILKRFVSTLWLSVNTQCSHSGPEGHFHLFIYLFFLNTEIRHLKMISCEGNKMFPHVLENGSFSAGRRAVDGKSQMSSFSNLMWWGNGKWPA